MKREQDEAPLDADVDGGSGSGESGPEASTGDTNAAAGAVEAVEAVANAAQDAVTNAAQDIGAFIRSQRVAAKVSLRQLAERAGVAIPTSARSNAGCASRRRTSSPRSPRAYGFPRRCCMCAPEFSKNAPRVRSEML